jgi:hypothetical protein
MSCGASSSSSVGTKCTFAAERLALFERSISNYTRMRLATVEAARSGKIDAHITTEDLAIIDRKIKSTSATMSLLKRCFHSG